jgi:hypothetical protein
VAVTTTSKGFLYFEQTIGTASKKIPRSGEQVPPEHGRIRISSLWQRSYQSLWSFCGQNYGQDKAIARFAAQRAA